MSLAKTIMGFYPSWISSDTYLSLNYDALTTISWAALGLNQDGSLNKPSGYPPSNLINYSHSKGKRVVLSVNPGWGSSSIDKILSSSNLQSIVINNLVNEVRTNNFDGIDIDFEGFPSTNSVNGQPNRVFFTQFITNLSNTFRSINQNYWISVDIPAIDWNNVFDTSTLSNYVTYLMLMAYDFHWQTGPTAGAVAPLTSPNGQSIVDSIDTYLQTVPSSKLLLGVPYYGYEWNTNGNSNPDASVSGSGISITYSDALNKISTYGRRWNSTWSCPWYFTGTSQGWYDDVQSLGLKYNIVNSRGLAGIGIWALGYDTPHPELSNLIINSFSGASTGCNPPCPSGYICQGNICNPTGGGGITVCSNNEINVAGICANEIDLAIILIATGILAISI